MPAIVWDKTGDRVYENGVSKAVLYLEDGRVIPWNGLTSVVERSDRSLSSIYFDGMKVNDFVSSSDFSASIKAITYPIEFSELEGLGRLGSGVFIGDQQPQPFTLSYQTQIGTDLDNDAGYKIHIIYNATAIVSDKNYSTISSDTSMSDFEWNLTAVPQEVAGHNPTAQIIIDSRYVNEELLASIELAIYGGVTADPKIISFDELLTMLLSFYVVEIIDNQDGTWTAIATEEGYISMLDDTEFQINLVDAVYSNPTTYAVSSTLS